MMNFPKVDYNTIQCKGGWDLSSPTLDLPPGYVRSCSNFEVAPTGGYSRIGGYERVDGHASPSAATYSLIQIVSFINTPALGDTITGFTSSSTGVVIVVGANYVAITKKSADFTIGETVKVGATVIGVVETSTTSLTIKQNAQYINLAADNYRADIGAVPGSGAVLGVALFNDIKYAFRANAGGTSVDMYKSSAAGWVQVSFEYEISFSNANTSVADGDVLTQGGVTATVRRVLVQTGTLLSGTNTGRLVISVPAGGNFAAGAATTTGAGALTLSAAQTAITMATGGKFEFVEANFFGQLSGQRLYGCDGVNRLFEFDGTYFVPISTGNATDTPKHITAHKNHLFCSIQSSVFNSGIGDAYNWTTTAGATEQPVGDTVTGLRVQIGSQTTGTLLITCKNSTNILYGVASSSWNMVQYSNGIGAIDYSVQQMSQCIFLDQQGVTSLAASQNYGNFDQATLTNGIKTFVKSKRALVAYSSLSREKSQYRLFFTDGSGLYLTIVNGKFLGAMQVNFSHPAYCAFEGEDTSGNEVLLFGSASGGYVYELDKGSSFDGYEITAYLTFNWNHAGSPRILKRWRKGSIEIQGTSYAEIQFSYALAYGSNEEIQPTAATYTSNFSTSAWDDASITWDSFFVWDGQTVTPTEVEMSGTSENVAVTLSSSLDYLYPYTINSQILHYTPRRGVR